MKQKKQIIVIGLLLLVIGIAAVFFMMKSSKKESPEATEEKEEASGLDLGLKYLDALEYDQALAVFRSILEMEPGNAEAYLGIVEVYIRTGEYELALEAAKEGLAVTGEEQLQEKIDMLLSGLIVRSDGKTVRMTTFDAESNMIWWHEYTYNKEGWLDQVRAYSADDNLQDEFTYLYDELGRPLNGYSYDDNGRLGKIEYTLGEGDEILKTVQYIPGQDVVRSIQTFEYDADGNMTKSANYDESGELSFYYLYRYENGRQSALEVYDNTDTLTLRSESEYDENGQRIAERTYSSYGLSFYSLYTYENGNMTSHGMYDSSDGLIHRSEYEYDENGKLIAERIYNSNGELDSESIYSE